MGTRQTSATPSVALRHWQIAELLQAQIKDGTYRVGERLPTEEHLCSHFGASRHSVREALKALTDDGLISRRPRAGSVVIASASPRRLIQTVGSVQELLNYPSETIRETIDTAYVVADHQMAMLLKCAHGESWFRIRALRFPKGSSVALCYTEIYVLPAYAGVIKHKRHLLIPVADQIEEMFGEIADSTHIDISASNVHDSIARLLKVEKGAPALTVVRKYANSEGRIFEAAVGVHPAQRYTYSFHLRRDRSAKSSGVKRPLAARGRLKA